MIAKLFIDYVKYLITICYYLERYFTIIKVIVIFSNNCCLVLTSNHELILYFRFQYVPFNFVLHFKSFPIFKYCATDDEIEKKKGVPT